MHESIAITEVLEECHEAVAGPEVCLDSAFCVPVFGLALGDFLCVAWFFVEAGTTDPDCVLLDEISLPCSLNSDFVRNARCCRVVSFLVSRNSNLLCRMDRPNPSMKVLLSADFLYATPQQRVFATIFSAHCDGFILAGCRNGVTADSVSAIISSVAYFSEGSLLPVGKR